MPTLQVGLEFLQKTIIDQKTGSNNFYIIYQVRSTLMAGLDLSGGGKWSLDPLRL